MKYLGIDYGTKRIGVALSDDTGSLAFPHSVIVAGPKALQEVLRIAQEHKVETIVMGESRNFKGEHNPVMEDIEQFKKDLEGIGGLPVTYELEFFSSVVAAQQYAPDGSRKANPSNAKLDAAAAAVILQSYLDRQKNTA